MKVVLDTNVLSELTKPKPNRSVSRMVLEAPRGSLFASEITRHELRFGALRHPMPEHIWARIQSIILPIPNWVAVNAEIAMRSAEIDARLTTAGRPIGAYDPFIAATALWLGCPVVTRNVRHFSLIDGLQVIDWHLEL
jgi:predicted nucleic acid-binding protein